MIKSGDLRRIFEGAKLYEKHLLNKEFLVVYFDNTKNEYNHKEIHFSDYNFQHLTGIIYKGKNVFNDGSISTMSKADFFYAALNKSLKIEDLYYKEDGTSDLKLQALNTAMTFPYTATMIGKYNNFRIAIIADICCGNIASAIALRCNENDKLKAVSLLKADVRTLVETPNPIKVICSKEKVDENKRAVKYSKVCRIAKNFDINILPDNIKSLISPDAL